MLAVAASSGDLQLLDLSANVIATDRKVSPDPLRSVAWVGTSLAVGTAAGGVHVLNAKTGDEIVAWKGEPVEVASLAFSPDGKKLAIGLRSTTWETPLAAPLQIWNFSTEKTPTPLVGHKQGVSCVRFSSDGKTLLSGSHDWTVRVWDVP